MRYIFKFGGTSLENVQKIKSVAAFITGFKHENNCELVVVVSAMGKTTNTLEALAKEVSTSPSPFPYARLLTQGEMISASLLAIALETLNEKTAILSASEIPISAAGDPTNSIITSINAEKITKHLKDKIVIVPGFQGYNNSQPCTLGRGGSDTTAVALSKALSADVKIFTDVDGFFATDPNKFGKSKKLEEINIRSAIELAHSGAKVLDKRCLELANTFKPSLEVLKSQTSEGTKVKYFPIETFQIDGVSCKNDIVFVKIPHKKTEFLQMSFKNNNFSPLFEEFVFGKFHAFAMSKEEYSRFESQTSLETECENADLVVICGSGFTFFKEFMQKMQNAVKKCEIQVKYCCLHPTFLKMLVPAGQGEKLTKSLKIEFNL